LKRTARSPADALAVSKVLERALTQSGDNIMDLSAATPVLLVFLRHAGCCFCREALGDIGRERGVIESSGTRIILVHMGETAAFDLLLLKYGLSEVDRISDGDRDLYRAFGIERGTLRQIFGPKVLWRGLLGGVVARHGMAPPRADISQMPAMFLVHQASIVRRFRHRTAADRPEYLAFCRGVTVSPGLQR
jgi:hypothetical protein